MVRYLKGRARVDKRTKNLVKRLSPRDIAVIDHRDLDEVAAQSLVASKIKAVINASPSISGDYPNQGPLALLRAGIYIIDNVGKNIMESIQEGEEIEICGRKIYKNGRYVGAGEVLTEKKVTAKMNEARSRLNDILFGFVKNTLQYAENELGLVAGEYKVPDVDTGFKGRHVLIVIRGHNYKQDLKIIRSYIEEVRPVLVGVDGGADALREFGYRPDVIIGDMDSVSDGTLRCGAELIVHAYPDGRAPGMERIRRLGLTAKTFAAPGTSEDIAMLLAYEKGCDLIVAVGAHSNILDFLEKGRKGMASTFLVRLKVGSILVDAKGVNKLYRSGVKARHLAEIFFAAMLPLFVVAIISPSTRELLKLIFIQFRLILGI